MKKISFAAAAAVVITALASAVAYGSATGEWVKHPENPVMGSPELGTCFDLNVVPWGKAE